MTQREQETPEVPDFDLIRPVGRGGFGEVWLGTNRTTGRLRAIKLIPLRRRGQSHFRSGDNRDSPPSGADPAAREIGSLARLKANSRCHHANLLRIDHVGRTAEHLFYVMDPADDVSGKPASLDANYRPASLDARLQQEALSPKSCLDYAQQLLAGLASLHAAGMVHRDVKPANCLFVGGQLKLADFGLLTEANPLVSRLGTQNYMPPDGRMDMRADVYAAGLVIYEMLTGLPVDEFPRLGKNAYSVTTDPSLSRLLRVVLHACEREPQRRPKDAREMLAELSSPPRSGRHFLRRRLLAGALGSIIAALCGWAVWWSIPHGIEPPAPKAVEGVDVNFITKPFEATIYLDGVLLRDAQGEPYTTPCMARGLPAAKCKVRFQWDDSPPAEAGEFDLASTRQIVFP